MAINPVKLLVASSATATNGSTEIAITGNVDTSRVYQGTILFLGNNSPVEALSGTTPDVSGNSTITLRDPWAFSTETTRLLAFNTIEGLTGAIEKATQVVEQTSGIEAIGGVGLIEKTGTNAYTTTTVTPKAREVLGRTNSAGLRTSLELGTASQGTITTSAYDTVAGRILKNGDFGLGDNAIPASTGTNLNNLTRTGWYYISSPVNAPNSTTTLLEVIGVADRVRQRAYTATTSQEWTRYQVGGIWQAWVEVPTQQNNALAISGSSASGNFVRFPDGTLICTRTNLPSDLNGDVNWAFPSAFISAPSVTITPVTLEFKILAGSMVTGNPTGDRFSMSFSVFDSTNNAVTTDTRLTAIGRWK